MRNTYLISPVSSTYDIPASHVAHYLSRRFGAGQYRVREDPFGAHPVVEALATSYEGIDPHVDSDGLVRSYRARVRYTSDRGWIRLGALEGYIRDLARIRAADSDLYAALTAR